MTDTFNLIDQPWILCMLDDGPRTLSLREVFEQASKIRRLAGESPTQDYAIFRLLLVIFWRAYRDNEYLTGSEKELDKWWQDMIYAATSDEAEDQEEMVAPVLAYLEEHRERFDLLDPAVPFMQVADLETNSKNDKNQEEQGKNICRIKDMIPDARSDYITARAGAGLDSLSYEEAARYLVAVHAWDRGGSKPGATKDPRTKDNKVNSKGQGWSGKTGGVVLHGQNLAQTLVLNTAPAAVFTENIVKDLPVWEQEPQGAANRGTDFPTGPCDVLTWQSRRVRLFPENGMIRDALVCSGDPIDKCDQFADPMTGYQCKVNKRSKYQNQQQPAPHRNIQTLWVGLQSLLPEKSNILVREEDNKDKKIILNEYSIRPPRTVSYLRTHQDKSETGKIENIRIRVELVGMTYGTSASITTKEIYETLPLKLSILMDSSQRTAMLIRNAAEVALQAADALCWFEATLEQAAGREYFFRTEVADAVLQELSEKLRLWLEELNPTVDHIEAKNQWHSSVTQSIIKEAERLRAAAGPKAEIGRFVEETRGAPTTSSNLRRPIENESQITKQRRRGTTRQLITAGAAENILKRQLRKILPCSHENSEGSTDSGSSLSRRAPSDSQQIGE